MLEASRRKAIIIANYSVFLLLQHFGRLLESLLTILYQFQESSRFLFHDWLSTLYVIPSLYFALWLANSICVFLMQINWILLQLALVPIGMLIGVSLRNCALWWLSQGEHYLGEMKHIMGLIQWKAGYFYLRIPVLLCTFTIGMCLASINPVRFGWVAEPCSDLSRALSYPNRLYVPLRWHFLPCRTSSTSMLSSMSLKILGRQEGRCYRQPYRASAFLWVYIS